ncbi:unnamed protein product [Moneuplotes crassus]|uniref:Protein kinase domain-containing protein n=1 Tax=Euplotes crassus TaxID=5936 RepID=A0AAD1XY64_EUPCR|nr:unnamed protein product [Moneuplotes crassus]
MNFDMNLRGKAGPGYIQSVIGRNSNYESLNQYIKMSMSKKLDDSRIDLARSINNSDFKKPIGINRKSKDAKYGREFEHKMPSFSQHFASNTLKSNKSKHLTNDSGESIHPGSFNQKERKISNLDDSDFDPMLVKGKQNLPIKKHVGTLGQIAQEIPKKYSKVIKKIPKINSLSNNHSLIRKVSHSINSEDTYKNIHEMEAQNAAIPKSYRIAKIGYENEHVKVRENHYNDGITDFPYSKGNSDRTSQNLADLTRNSSNISEKNFFGYHTLENKIKNPNILRYPGENYESKITAHIDHSMTENTDMRSKHNPSKLSNSASEVESPAQRNYNPGRITDFYTMSEIIIGKGSYAVVKMGFKNPTAGTSSSECKKVAIKIYNKAVIKKKQKRGSVDQEINALFSLNHENIIRLYDVFQDDLCIYLVTEYIDGESLLSYMKKKPNKRCSMEVSRELFKQIISGISYCHQQGFAHRDIKLENILVTKLENKKKMALEIPLVKIIDFGFAVQYQIGEKGTTYCGTPNYMAPELIKKEEFDYELVDVWALGVLFYSLLTGLFPFKGASNKDMFSRITKGNYIIPERIKIGPKRLIMKMLQVNPEHRSKLRNITDKWLMQDTEEKIQEHKLKKKQLFDQLQ